MSCYSYLMIIIIISSPSLYYSINKQNSEFTPNTDETVCQGHKWGLLALWRYMRTHLGINTERVWDSIKDLVIKTIISSEPYVSSYVKAFVKNRLVRTHHTKSIITARVMQIVDGVRLHLNCLAIFNLKISTKVSAWGEQRLLLTAE